MEAQTLLEVVKPDDNGDDTRLSREWVSVRGATVISFAEADVRTSARVRAVMLLIRSDCLWN